MLINGCPASSSPLLYRRRVGGAVPAECTIHPLTLMVSLHADAGTTGAAWLSRRASRGLMCLISDPDRGR